MVWSQPSLGQGTHGAGTRHNAWKAGEGPGAWIKMGQPRLGDQ